MRTDHRRALPRALFASTPAAALVAALGVALLAPAPAARGADDAPRLLPDGTVLPDRDVLDCVFRQRPVRNGTPPPLDLTRRLIRCLYERPALPGRDGAVTVDLSDVSVGAPRPWAPDQDVGSGGAGTLVYPVHAVWTQKTWYRGGTAVQTNESVFHCNVSALATWECRLGQRIKDGPVTRAQPR